MDKSKVGVILAIGLCFLFMGFKIAQEYDVDQLRSLYSSGDKKLWPKAFIDQTLSDYEEIGHLPKVKFPEDNPYTEAKKTLGKTLFFDPRLSVSGQIACASCHDSEIGWGDGRRVSYGHNRQQGRRNAMSLLNVAFADKLFWDGRAESLEEQVQFPVQDSLEMNFHISLAVDRISQISGYKELFKEAYGDTTVTDATIRKAIATYERTIISESTRFDKFIDGESDQYSNAEVLGLHLFRTKARCINCHQGGYFSDNEFHNIGLTYYGRKYEDLGLYEVTGKKEDVGKFRTSSLREISRTGPFMHNGLFPHLRGVVNMYNAGMPRPKRKPGQEQDTLFPETSPLLIKLDLSDYEKFCLIRFLGTLESRNKRESVPDLPE
ncbi:cytochrome-c peroxidase [Sinomicrobium sp.]